MKNRKIFMKGLVATLLFATLGTSTVSALELKMIRDTEEIINYTEAYDLSEEFEANSVEEYLETHSKGNSSVIDGSYDNSYRNSNKNYILDKNGELVTYTRGLDFTAYKLYDEFIYNSIYGEEDVLKVREGLSAKDFLKIIVCNQPSYFIYDEYVFKVNKNSDGTMSVMTYRKVEGENYRVLRDKYAEIVSEIITDDMSDYEKAKTIYDYIYDNISYGKGVSSNAYEVLINGKAANSDTITSIAANLLERASVANKSIVGITSNNKYHYFNIVDIGNDYVFDVALDLKNNDKYGHFLTATKNLSQYKIGTNQQFSIDLSNVDFIKYINTK